MDDRILVLMPTSKDGQRMRQALELAGLEALIVKDIHELCREIPLGAGAVLLTEAAAMAGCLQDALRSQPPWSDLPLVVLAHQESDGRGLRESMNATLVERPVKVRSLLSVIRAALRSRRHQYAVRDHLETIRQERERYRVTLSSIGDAVIAVDAGGHVSFMNRVAESMTGWPQAEAVGRPLEDTFRIINEDTREPADNPALRVLREGAAFAIDNRTVLIARDGIERPIDDNAAPIREGERHFGAVLVFRDVSERKRAEEDRARLAAIVESSDDAIIGNTLDGIIQSWNAGAERLFGYLAGEAIGQPITFIIPPERHDEERSILARLSTGERIEHFETVRATKDGRLIDISLTASPIRNAAGQVIGASKVARDITEKKRADADRARLTESLALAISAGDLGTWQWDPITDQITISDRAAEIYGVPAGTHVREEMRVLIRADYRDRARQEAARSVAERTDYDLEYPLKSGRWVAARGRGEYDETGTLLRMLGVVADVTARKQSEFALRESELLNRFLVKLAAATQSLTDADEIMAATARLLAEELNVDRCAYAEVEAESVYVITGEHTRGVSSIIGKWDVAAFGAEHLRAMMKNIPYIVDDVQTDSRISPQDLPAFRATEITAAICVPLHKGGRFTAAMAVHQKVPRRWTGAEVKLVTTVVDRCWEVLERARVARELEDIRSRMEMALEAGAIGTWSWDIPRDQFHGDASLAGIFGVPFQAVAGGPLAGLMGAIHPDDRERVGELVRAAVTAGGRYEADYRVAGNGSWRWVNSRGRAEFDADGRPIRFPGVVIDITERKQIEEALARVTADSERKKRLYETALSNTPDLVYVFSLDHRFYYANEALLKTWGKSWEEAIGKTCLELGYEPWHAAKHDAEIERVIATKMPIRGEVPFTGTNGRRIHDYIFVPVFGASGDVEAVAGTTRDITERQAMEQELREADRKKDDFIALLAHELRNPLAPIRNGLQVIRLAGNDPQTLNEARSMMDRQLGHMVRLIDDLLDVSRISRNKMELRRTRVTLAEVVASAVETALPAIEEIGHQLSVALPATPVHLNVDLTRMAQVFSNLLTNSAKYTPPIGHIWLTAEVQGDHVVVSVRDDGIGIPDDSLNDIFDMFSQVDRSTEKTTGGLGIGLALVKGLVEMHGGTVTAASEGEGLGSTFTVTLPLLTEEHSLAAPLDEIRARESRRILVVDDNQDGANSLAMMLRLLGDDVATAYDGQAACEVAETFRPSAILMDVGMPRMNGLEATRQIRRKAWGHGIIIIALTGWGQENDRKRSEEAGCDGHLVKPVHLPDLEQLMTELQAAR
ncbi:MAG: PAS domain S-box protein [Planctomycetaceae bacterium]|nr:PAS domain S-box protein [Planctomycetaceae bacterium]